jgi:hypothetical protein
MGVDVGKAELDFRNAMRIMSRFSLSEEARPFEICGKNGVKKRVIAPGGFLRDGANPRVAGHSDGAGLRLEIAEDQMQESRLADAIAAHQADLMAGRYGNAGIIEQEAPGNAEGEGIHMQHGRAV